MASISQIINKTIHGDNSFCSLCFKTDQNILFHNEINICLDDTEHNIMALTDILHSVFRNEVQEYLSVFDNICEECINFAVNIYRYIETCHNNVKNLLQALDMLNNSIDCTKDQNEETKSLFVSIDLNTSTIKHIYDDKRLDSTTLALKQFNLLNTPKIQETSSKIKPKSNSSKINISDMVLDPNSELYTCKQCLKTFTSLWKLKRHYLKVHMPEDYVCIKCLQINGSPTLLAHHISVNHCEMICSMCGKKFSNKISFIRHEASHHMRLVCPKCGRVYKNSITYNKHISLNVCKQETRASPADAQYTCDYCGKKYTQKVSLRVHIQYFHGNYKPHVCKWCGKKFWAQSRLKAHIVKHTKEKNFICSVCQGKFVTRESLLYHTRLHTGEKPYKCSQCDCTFLSSSRRAYHTKTYHRKSIVECENCHSKFTSVAYLDKHKKAHRQCQINRQIDSNTSSNSADNNQQKTGYCSSSLHEDTKFLVPLINSTDTKKVAEQDLIPITNEGYLLYVKTTD